MTAPAAARNLAIAAAGAVMFSIAAKEILLGAAVAVLLFTRQRWTMPRSLLWPLGLFCAGTVLAALVSPEPVKAWPQIRKFYAFLILPVLLTNLRGAADARLTILLCAAAGVLSSLWSCVQFVKRWQEAQALGANAYHYVIGRRTTGFMSHWMTFGGEIGIVLVFVLALVFFTRDPRRRWWTAAAGVMAVALVLNMTRGIWLAAGAAVVYLVWVWKPRVVWVLPLLAAAPLALEPVRERARSIFQPHGEADSNQHRLVTFRTGLEMVKAHPWFGVGPERVGGEFNRFVPPDIRRPLPEGFYGHLHNNYLQYAADRGLPAALCFVWLLVAFLLELIRSPGERWLKHGATAAWITIVLGGFTEWNLGTSEVLHLFLVAMACGIVPATHASCSVSDRPKS